MAAFGGLLHEAVRSSNIRNVLNECNKNPNGVNDIVGGLTALHLATEPRIARILLDNGASPEMTDGTGHTPAFHAVKLDNSEVLDVLGEVGRANFEHIVGGTTPLHTAASEGFHRCILSMCKRGQPSTANSSGDSIGSVSTSESEQPRRANVDCKDEHGETPLHRAAEEGHTKSVQTLLQLGAHWNGGFKEEAESEDGDGGPRGAGPTPAHLAAAFGHEGVIRALGKAGCSFHQCDEHGRDVYDIAEKHGHGWLFKIMEEIDEERGRGPGGKKGRRAAAGGGEDGASTDGSAKGSYLGLAPGGRLRGNRGDVQLPEAWNEYKWPWQRPRPKEENN
jgi:cytohesin